MFPYHDENETERTPVITIAIITLCFGWISFRARALPARRMISGLRLHRQGEFTQQAPVGSGFRMDARHYCTVIAGPEYEIVFTSMFLHGGWMHLLGNMWFLWLFGNNMEDARARAFLSSICCADLLRPSASLAQCRFGAPMVGASGAISGVMGAYLVLYPRVGLHPGAARDSSSPPRAARVGHADLLGVCNS